MERTRARLGLGQIGAVLAAFALLALVFPAIGVAAQVSTPVAQEDQTYVDPTNRFAVPIPTNWIAEEQDGFVRVATSDGKIEIFAGMVDATGATPAIDVLLTEIDPEFESAALVELLATPAATTDDSAFYTFDDGVESGQMLQALGRKVGENEVFVLVLRGDLETVGLRQVQIDKIFAGVLIRTESSATPVASPAA